MATSSKNKLTYHILYGFLCGPAHSKQLRDKLDQLGFQQNEDAANSDLLIAHSAGCWDVPDKNNAKLIVLVGMTLANQNSFKSFIRSNYANFTLALKTHKLFSSLSGILLKNCYYAVKQPIRNYKIARNIGAQRQLHEYPQAEVIFIANSDDPWPHVSDLQTILDKKNYQLVEMPGAHDNIWGDPDSYIKLIEQNV